LDGTVGHRIRGVKNEAISLENIPFVSAQARGPITEKGVSE
jgi:hypothetical protein